MNLLTSTRQSDVAVQPSEAMLSGIAPDGGLYLPKQLPKLSIEKYIDLPYADLVGQILSLFLDEWSTEQLTTLARRAYGAAFANDNCTQYQHFDKLHFCELYHGPTFAFKDFALAILPHLLSASLSKRNSAQRLLILTATSGDTGKAALQGFQDNDNIDIVVFYPNDGVSPIQARQMQTQPGNNLTVLAIEGNFDDAQSNVKKMFTDTAFNDQVLSLGAQLSSANSINIGRLLPQIAYYVDSYRQLCKSGSIDIGEAINFVVPTGNFGNILAAYYAKQMGLPIDKLICASNCNDVLTEFINTGSYNAKRAFYTTMSPSMDILISSNLERLLYHLAGDDSAYVASLMQQLATEKRFVVNATITAGLADFKAYACAEDDTKKAIKAVFDNYRYLIDPHTAVAYHCYQQYQAESGDSQHGVIMATASPFKFPTSVCQSLGCLDDKQDDYQLIDRLATLAELPAPPYFKTLRELPLLHEKVIKTEQMPTAVIDYLRSRS